ncbi:MAG: hypothetical protein MJ219_00565 [Mycoplasmoidaceae bacterium]|nr:hypothetical protein [Mycoplasmoidaceae bacterium]
MFSGVYDGNEPYTLPDSSKFVLKSYCFSGLNAGLNFSTVPSNYLP